MSLLDLTLAGNVLNLEGQYLGGQNACSIESRLEKNSFRNQPSL